MSIQRDNGQINYDDLVSVKNHVTIPFELARRKILAGYPMAANNMELRLERTIEGMLVELRTWFLGSYKDPITRDILIPKNWFEHFKKDLFPRWALVRWPVRYNIETVKIQGPIHICPHLNDKLRREEHLSFVSYESDYWYGI